MPLVNPFSNDAYSNSILAGFISISSVKTGLKEEAPKIGVLFPIIFITSSFL